MYTRKIFFDSAARSAILTKVKEQIRKTGGLRKYAGRVGTPSGWIRKADTTTAALAFSGFDGRY